MKNWKYGANPKKIPYARRRAQPGRETPLPTHRVIYVTNEKTGAIEKKVVRYEYRVAETPTPLPDQQHSPGENPSRGEVDPSIGEGAVVQSGDGEIQEGDEQREGGGAAQG